MPKGIPSNLTDKDINDMIQLFNSGKTYFEIGQIYNISRQLVGRKLKQKGIKNKYDKITEEEKQLVIMKYNECHNQDYLSKILSMDVHNIRKILHNAGIRTNDTYCHQKYNVNENYFDEINTPNKAYILGLLYADGNLTKKGNTWRIALQERDKEVLEKISKEINTNRPLLFQKRQSESSQDQYLLSVTNEHMYKSLLEKGLMPAKSLILQYPNFLDNEFQNHFIRGYYDGDGTSYCGKNGKFCNFIGTLDFCTVAKSILNKELDINVSLYPCGNNGITTTLQISGGRQVKRFFDWIYLDSTALYLDRKYQKYLKDYCK